MVQSIVRVISTVRLRKTVTHGGGRVLDADARDKMLSVTSSHGVLHQLLSTLVIKLITYLAFCVDYTLTKNALLYNLLSSMINIKTIPIAITPILLTDLRDHCGQPVSGCCGSCGGHDCDLPV